MFLETAWPTRTGRKPGAEGKSELLPSSKPGFSHFVLSSHLQIVRTEIGMPVLLSHPSPFLSEGNQIPEDNAGSISATRLLLMSDYFITIAPPDPSQRLEPIVLGMLQTTNTEIVLPPNDSHLSDETRICLASSEFAVVSGYLSA